MTRSSRAAFYVVLFIYSIYALRRHSPTACRVLVVAAWIMFLLGTSGALIAIMSASVAMRMIYLLVQGSTTTSAHLINVYHVLALTQDVVLAINNLATDLLFLYRCYVIWGSRRKVVVLPAILILATVAVGCISGLGYYRVIKLGSSIDQRVPFGMGAATNVLLMCLTAGRIWHIRREGHIVTGQRFRKQYDTAVAIIMESGLLYCVCAVIYVISATLNTGSAFGTIFVGVSWGLVQLGVNIVPTLILVRVGMGRSTENTSPFTGEENLGGPDIIFSSRNSQRLDGETKRHRWSDLRGASGMVKLADHREGSSLQSITY
ncbi:hypothetical protein C8J57DRAFT_1599421 [Mycena rebaudengoi]|nr:hypothetical protein C8J57DRAFT_1599421 [Mycena rebaudengoi]